MANNREWSVQYLNKQYAAMRWLAKQGLAPEKIRLMSWGQVDEFDRTIRVKKQITNIMYDFDTKMVYRKEYDYPIKVPYQGSGQEWFFEKSKYPCMWMFTAFIPKSWRKEQAREALFPLEVVEKICKDLRLPEFKPLTILTDSANIEVSKLNIHKSKTNLKLAREAVIVAEAND